LTFVRALTIFKLEGEVTSLSGSSPGEVEDNRERWGDFWEFNDDLSKHCFVIPLKLPCPNLVNTKM
jgi:hypothetical protein